MTETGVVYGLAAGGRIVRSDSAASTDGGQPIAARIEGVPLALAGPSGEFVVPLLHLTVSWTMAVSLLITPIVDGVEYPDVVPPIALAAKPALHTETLEIPLTYQAQRADLSVWGKFALRGTWFALRIETDALAAGELIFEAPTIEYEVVQESRAPVVG